MIYILLGVAYIVFAALGLLDVASTGQVLLLAMLATGIALIADYGSDFRRR